MNSGYIVEISGDAVGVLVSAGGAYEFHAVDARFRSLEGATFENGFAAERAARRLVRRGGGEPVRRGRRQYSLFGDDDASPSRFAELLNRPRLAGAV